MEIVRTKSTRKVGALPVVQIVLSASLILLCMALYPTLAKAERLHDGRGESLTFEPLATGSGIVGLNYVIGSHGYPAVSDLYKGGLAEKAGIKIGDEILAVGDDDTRYIGYLHLQQLLTGESGSTVSLKLRQDGGATKTVSVVRASVESCLYPKLHQYEVAKWRRAGGGADISSKPAERTSDHASERTSDHGSERTSDHGSEHLIDLPFAMLSREHNRPTLFEFTDKESDHGVGELLKKHNDGSYIMSQCKVMRITKDDPDYAALHKYLGLTGEYGLIPIYQPWLVTVKESDILMSVPTESQLNSIARNLVHNSIKVQVSHTVAKQNGSPEAQQKLNKRPGLHHKAVLKRICQTLPAGAGIVGLGFAAGADGYAIVTQVYARGPAEKAGLRDGDRILEVDGLDTRYLGLEHIQAALTGPIGQEVNLKIKSAEGKTKNSAVSGAVGAGGSKAGAGSVGAGSVGAESAGAGSAGAGSVGAGSVGAGGVNDISPGATRKLTLKFEPLATFPDPSLAKLTISKWQRVLSATVDDSNEYELPCCMLAAAHDQPTIFEFCHDQHGASVNANVEKLKSSGKISDHRIQVVTYNSTSKDYESLRRYFQITSDYACFPVYYRGKHKTIKSNELMQEVPSEKRSGPGN